MWFVSYIVTILTLTTLLYAQTPLNKQFWGDLCIQFACSVFNAAFLLLLLLFNDLCFSVLFFFVCVMDSCCHHIALWVYNKDGAEANWLYTNTLSTVTEKFNSNNFQRDSSLVDFGVHKKKRKEKYGRKRFISWIALQNNNNNLFFSFRNPNQHQQKSDHRLLLLLQVTHMFLLL